MNANGLQCSARLLRDSLDGIVGGVVMIVWFDDLDLGTRYQCAEIEVTRDDIKRRLPRVDRNN